MMGVADSSGMDPAQAANRAFEQSEGYRFEGQLLHPFSIERQAAAQRFGLKYGRLSESECRKVPFKIPVEKPKKGEPKFIRSFYLDYPGMIDDVMLVVYVCTLEP